MVSLQDISFKNHISTLNGMSLNIMVSLQQK